MKKFKILLVAGIAMMTGATAASAEGLYAGASVGVSGGGGADNYGDDLLLAGGFLTSAVIGKEFGNGRFEGEIAYRQNDMDSFTYLGITYRAAGEISSLAFMANAYYDFGAATSTFRPYVGIGFGAASVTMNSLSYNTYATETTFAMQIMLGGSIAFSDSLAMTVDLRSFAAIPVFTTMGGVQFEQEYGVASAMVGVRQSF